MTNAKIGAPSCSTREGFTLPEKQDFPEANLTLVLFIAMSCLLATNLTYGQERCSTIFDPSKVSTEIRENVENFFRRVENTDPLTKTLNNFDGNTGVVLIPVVVHVVHNTTSENISDAQICSQIEVLNQDFAETVILTPSKASNFKKNP